MEKIFLDAELREELGKGKVKALRRSGFIPAVIYKRGDKATSLKLPKKDFIKTLHTKAGENVLITLQVSKDKSAKKPSSKTVLIKNIQLDPVKDEVIHVDFNEISLTEKIKVKVPIADKGEAIGVKRDEGVLEHIIWEVEVECLPTQIPEKLEANVTNLEIGQDIFVKDIPVPEGVQILADPESIVVSVKPPKEEVVVEEPTEGLEEPEMIREKKPESEEEAAPEEASKDAPKQKEDKKEK